MTGPEHADISQCQDCDTFLCLRTFHDEFIAAAENRTAACSAVEEYVDCVSQATNACTRLGIAELQTAADRMKTYAICRGTQSSLPQLGLVVIGTLFATCWRYRHAETSYQ
ncbi:uncharacterized protein LOC124138318 [Haliotis rufescens]|uniref:uncharacterized protein LOC124138318 n=1 Tax=Haliotis rufescens TaxID=6454 RepID=UPI00201F1DD3|nr:uncharacterized protein LOC124138318 [Haliotis rufescens]